MYIHVPNVSYNDPSITNLYLTMYHCLLLMFSPGNGSGNGPALTCNMSLEAGRVYRGMETGRKHSDNGHRLDEQLFSIV
jgi:hypothetical protein